MFTTEIDWAPAYELVASMTAYLAREDHKTLELGARWLRRVRTALSAEQQSTLCPAARRHNLPLVMLVRHCPGTRTPDEFIRWLGAIPVGEIYEMLVPELVEAEHDILANLGDLRDMAVRELSIWNEAYFQYLDGAILDGLRHDAESRRKLMGTMPPEVFVEHVTNGLQLSDEQAPTTVVLVPQYHFRPWNLYYVARTTWFISYPADALPTVPGEPPMALLRLARALSDESRLRILHFLVDEPRTFTEIQRFTGLSKGTVHHHMVTLRAAGLIRVHSPLRKGTKAGKYFLRPEAIEDLSESARMFLKGS